MKKPAASILGSVFALCACSSPNPNPTPPPSPVLHALMPVEVSDTGTTIPSARVSWHVNGPDTPPRSTNLGVEIAFAQGAGRGDQRLAVNQHVSLDGGSLDGPQQVGNRAEVRYSHVALNGITRFARAVELDYFLGMGKTRLNLRSESRTTGDAPIQSAWTDGGLTVGLGPRWHVNKQVALEARLQTFVPRPDRRDEFWYPEIAVRYRPIPNLALRVGYSEMTLEPRKRLASDSDVRVHIGGPFLGAQLMF